jgi:hypothetical protein
MAAGSQAPAGESGGLNGWAALRPIRHFFVATVLIDGENVRRSLWPNIPKDELPELVRAWADEHGHDAEIVWEGDESADDRIAREVASLQGAVWVVTSDRQLRDRVASHVERIVGGGSFARELRVR